MNDVPTILTGDEADDAFGHLVKRDPEAMRAETERAFENIHDIFAAQGLLLVGLLNRRGHEEKTNQ